MKSFNTLILLTILTAILTGCRTADLPPGFTRVGGVLQTQTSHVASPNAVYSLMVWYEEANAELNPPRTWSEAVAHAKEEARHALNEQWKAALLKAATPLLQSDLEHVVTATPQSLANRTDWDKLDALIRNTKALLLTEHKIAVPYDECGNDAFWSQKSTYGKADFLVWGKDRKLTVEDAPNLNRQALIAQVNAVEEDIKLKRSIYDALEKVEQMNRDKAHDDALTYLNKIIDSLPENPLATIHDETTVPLLMKRFAEQPLVCMNQVLDTTQDNLAKLKAKKELANFKQLLGICELTLSDAMKRWLADARFEKGLEFAAVRLRTIVSDMRNLRLDAFKREISYLAGQNEFWAATLAYQNAIKEMTDKEGSDFAIYYQVTENDGSTTFAKLLANGMQLRLKDIVPHAADYLLGIAEKSADIGQRHGETVAICLMLKTLFACADAASDDSLQEIIARTNTLNDKSTRVILEKQLSQTISVKDMESGQPGLGLTYTRDVINALQSLLIAFGLDKTVSIAEPGTPLSPLGYVLHNGVVADYDGSATTERQAFRTARRWGEIKRMANPDYQKDSQQPKDIFTQEVIEQLVHIREIERQAHIRVFYNVRGPGFTTTVDVNEFYPKRFIVEESHPFNDIKVADVNTVYDLDKLKVPDELPPLKQDRIWTAAEMLDYARKDSLQVFSLKLLYHINQFPAYLAARAKRFAEDGAIADATEQWAYCRILCSLLDFDQDPATLIKSDVPPVAASYETTINALRKQRSELAELKRTVDDIMLATAAELLKQDRKKDAR